MSYNLSQTDAICLSIFSLTLPLEQKSAKTEFSSKLNHTTFEHKN